MSRVFGRGGHVGPKRKHQAKGDERNLMKMIFPPWKHADLPSMMRQAYETGNESRPKFRGSLMAFLHRSYLWLSTTAVYVAVVAQVAPLASVLLRVALSAATLWGIWASDWLHNLDRIDTFPANQLKAANHNLAEVRRRLELFFMRHDVSSISVIVCTSFLIWSDNFGWAFGLGWCAIVNVLCSATVVVLAMWYQIEGNVFAVIKAIMGLQFFGLFGFMMYNHMATCRLVFFGWCLQLLGVVAYIFKPFLPESRYFGPHEFFHTCVVATYVYAMSADVALKFFPCVALSW